jgi:hypothetical protein
MGDGAGTCCIKNNRCPVRPREIGSQGWLGKRSLSSSPMVWILEIRFHRCRSSTATAQSGQGRIFSASRHLDPWPAAWLGCDLALVLFLMRKKLAVTIIKIATAAASQDDARLREFSSASSQSWAGRRGCSLETAMGKRESITARPYEDTLLGTQVGRL